MDVTNFFPYNEMTQQTDTTIGACVKIPKIYVKNSVDENGLITREISKTQQTGYHCHPAFMHNGQERGGILIACNIVSGSEKTFDEAQTEIKGLGGIKQTATGNTYGEWEAISANTNNEIHMYNIFEHHLLAMLMLTEYETTDIKTAMGLTEQATTGIYRGITQHWGDINLWCDGLEVDGVAMTSPSNYLRIFDNTGNFQLIETTQNISNFSGLYPITISNDKNTNWDLSDIFIMKTSAETKNNGSFGTIQSFAEIASSKVNATISYKTESESQNPFAIIMAANTQANYRLAKFTD